MERGKYADGERDGGLGRRESRIAATSHLAGRNSGKAGTQGEPGPIAQIWSAQKSWEGKAGTANPCDKMRVVEAIGGALPGHYFLSLRLRAKRHSPAPLNARPTDAGSGIKLTATMLAAMKAPAVGGASPTPSHGGAVGSCSSL